MSNTLSDVSDTLEPIAISTLSGVNTLKTRNNDTLDFHTLAIWEIQDALFKAYEAGRSVGYDHGFDEGFEDGCNDCS